MTANSALENTFALLFTIIFSVAAFIGDSSFLLIQPLLHAFSQTLPSFRTGFETGHVLMLPSLKRLVSVPSVVSGRIFKIQSLQICSSLSALWSQKMHCRIARNIFGA